MPKIRGVKPDLWTDEDFVELSPYARLLWIGLWNLACDNGHLQDKSKQIKMRILPTDDVNCAELLREIEDQGLIKRARGWVTIPNLSHHQKPHKRWWTTCEKPGCELPEGASHAPANRGTTVAPPKATSGTTADGDGDGDGDGELKKDLRAAEASQETTPPSIDEEFAEWYEMYPRKRGKGQALKAYRRARKSVDADTLIAAIRQQASALTAKGDEFCPYPATWLNGERWADEEAPSAVHHLPHASEIEQPPDGLSDEEYAAWWAVQRERRRA